MEPEYTHLINCVNYLSKINPDLSEGMDKEDISLPGKYIGLTALKINTSINYLLGKWFYSLRKKPREWKKYAVQQAFHLSEPTLIRNKQAQLTTLARIYGRVPPDVWHFEKFWSWYELLDRMWDNPIKQIEYAERWKEPGIDGELKGYLSTIEKKPVRQWIRKVKKKISDEYIIVNKITGEIKEGNEWETLVVEDIDNGKVETKTNEE